MTISKNYDSQKLENNVLLIDNYDSFTFNIYQLLAMLNQRIIVRRNDKISLDEIKKLNPTHIIIGPGPNSPSECKNCVEIIDEFKGKVPILGICLGHEVILHSYNVPIVNAKNILHGKLSKISHSEDGIFTNIAQGFNAVRYHSLAGKQSDIENLTNELQVTALSEDDEVMAIAHKRFLLFGVQFHPESYGSEFGMKLMQNFLHAKELKVPVKKYLNKLTNLENLDFEEAYNLMDCIAQNDLNASQIASMITSFKIKEATFEEIGAFASFLIEHGAKFDIPSQIQTIDIVGTGGSSKKTFNVSSTVAIILAAFGLKVLKHGNNAVTSKSGSADLLNALGVNVNMSLEISQKCFNNLGITFLFAPKIHSALKNVQNIRKELGFKSIFNLLGPLSNPFCPTYQMIGVFDKKYTEILAFSLKRLGFKNALIVSALDGMDEISLCDETQITHLKNGEIKTFIFNPFSFVKRAKYHNLKGGNASENAKITIDILSGIDSQRADLVALNAGAALFLHDKAQSIEEGYFKIKEFLKENKSMELLEKFKKLSFEKVSQ